MKIILYVLRNSQYVSWFGAQGGDKMTKDTKRQSILKAVSNYFVFFILIFVIDYSENLCYNISMRKMWSIHMRRIRTYAIIDFLKQKKYLVPCQALRNMYQN